MPELKRKSKTISLRISSDEYEALRARYEHYGTRSVSEFARLAMQNALEPQASAIERRLSDLDGKMSVLDREMGRLSRLIEQKLTRSAGDAE